MRWHRPVCEDLPYVSNDEIQQGEGQVIAAPGESLKEMGAFNYRPHYLLESNGFMAILVFVDKLTKKVHLVGRKRKS